MPVMRIMTRYMRGKNDLYKPCLNNFATLINYVNSLYYFTLKPNKTFYFFSKLFKMFTNIY